MLETAEPEESPQQAKKCASAHFLAISRTRISYDDALERTACAPFREERRMKFTEATKFHRKSGGEPQPVSVNARKTRIGSVPFTAITRVQIPSGTCRAGMAEA